MIDKQKWQIKFTQFISIQIFRPLHLKMTPNYKVLTTVKIKRIWWWIGENRMKESQKYFCLFSLISSLAIVQTEPNSTPVSSEKRHSNARLRFPFYLEMSSLLFARLFSSLFLKENKRQENDFLTPVVHKS